MSNKSFINFWNRLSRNEEYTLAAESAENVNRVITSIKTSLFWLFNTRKGDATCALDYGLPDLTGVVVKLPRSSDYFCKVIKNTVENYEPRIKEAFVRLAEDFEGGEKVFFDISVVLNPPYSRSNMLISWEVDLDLEYKVRI